MLHHFGRAFWLNFTKHRPAKKFVAHFYWLGKNFVCLIYSNRRWAEKWHGIWSLAIGLYHCIMMMVTNRRLHFMQLLPMTWHKIARVDARVMANACWVIANAILALAAMIVAKVSGFRFAHTVSPAKEYERRVVESKKSWVSSIILSNSPFLLKICFEMRKITTKKIWWMFLIRVGVETTI